MSTTLLAEYDRKARKFLVCQICHREIAPGTQYLEQRLAGDGSAYTFRTHHVYELTDLSDGHLPPCWHAWDRGMHVVFYPWYYPFIGPPAPCTCDAAQ